jgi:parallel beta-helix repeat protein
MNGIGAAEGTDNPAYYAAEGIYMDNHTANVAIINNTVAKSNNGIVIHNANNISISGNTLYNNNIQLNFSHDQIDPTSSITNCTVSNNILFAKVKSQILAEFTTVDDDIPNFGVFDNNYYCRPIDDESTFFVKYVEPSGKVQKFMDLETWQTNFHYDLHSKKSPITIPTYNLINYVDSNKIINGKFENDLSGWRYTANYSNCFTSWDNSGKLNNGCLKFNFNSPTGNVDESLSAIIDFDSVIEGENYILKFAMIGSYPGKASKTYMGITVDPFDLITPVQFINLSTMRKDFQFLFTPESSQSKARIYFQVFATYAPVWLDNVELYKANIIMTNPDDYIKFLYNPTNSAVQYYIGEDFIDIKGNKSANISLQPYTSVILLKKSTDHSVSVDEITVTGEGGKNNIYSTGGTLQLYAEIFPSDAGNSEITWSIINGTGQASISNNGLVTAISVGTVTAIATANDGSGVYGSLIITISNIQDSISNPSNISKLFVYPNPVNSELYVLNTGSHFNSITITDIEGRIIREGYYASELSYIDVSFLSKGIYILQFKNQKNIAMIKFIKN